MNTNYFGWLHQDFQTGQEKQSHSDDYHTETNRNRTVKHPKKSFFSAGNYNCAYSGNIFWRQPTDQEKAEEIGHAAHILNTYLEKGPGFLLNFSGAFSIAITNGQKQSAFLAIDKMGIERMVYSDINGFSYSNNISFLIKNLNISPPINHQAIYHYVYFHMVPSPETIYQGIYKIEPGHFIEFENGNITTKRYWKPDFKKTDQDTFYELAEQLPKLLESATRKLATCDSGAFLSGGLDSSSVSGMLSKIHPKPQTFTIGFDAQGYDETSFAQIASDHFSTDHHVYYVTQNDVLDSVPTIAAAYDEPFGNSSAIPTYFCAKLAYNHGCETLLAGDGGDEIFGGNDRYVTQKIFETYLSAPILLKSVIETVCSSRKSSSISLFRKAQSFLRQTKIPLPDRMENYNFLHQITSDNIFCESFLKSVDIDGPISNLRIRYQEPESADFLDRILYLDWKRTLADNDLRKVTEMCKLAGVDVRFPMLDDSLVEWSTSIPNHLKIKGFKIRHFYKVAMKGCLPDKIINKPKHGFGLPFGIWMSKNADLQDMAYSSINRLKYYGYFRDDFLDQTIQLHKSGHAKYYGELIWILMILEHWMSSHN